MLEMAWAALCILVILLLYPVGFLTGYARGRNAKLLAAMRDLCRGEDDGDRDPKAP